MDWQAFNLSLKLGLLTLVVLLPPAILLGRWLAVTGWRWKPVVEALVLLPQPVRVARVIPTARARDNILFFISKSLLRHPPYCVSRGWFYR